MKKRKITAFRLCILLSATVFTTYGASLLGKQFRVILPVLSCTFVPSSGATGICKSLVGIGITLTSGAGVFLLSMLGMIALCVLGILLFGRLWCGFVCPFGFYQELLAIIRRKLRLPNIRTPESARPFLRLLKWLLVLLLLLGSGFCNLCPAQYIMPSLAGYGSEISILGTILSGIVTGLCFFKERIFCEYCPMGTLMGFANKTSVGRIKKKGIACTHCRACLECCPMDIELICTEREKTDITHADCIYCMKCIEACPEPDALAFTILGQKVLASKREMR